jgi:hypothetical protein
MKHPQKRQPWERLPHESVAAFSAFEMYRRMGRDRSLRAVAQELTKSSTLIKRWSARNGWLDRVQAFDDWAIALELMERKKAAKAEAKLWAKRICTLLERQWECGEALLARANEMLNFPLTKRIVEIEKYEDGRERSVIEIHPVRWNLETACQLLKVASRLMRQATGSVTIPQQQPSTRGFKRSTQIP